MNAIFSYVQQCLCVCGMVNFHSVKTILQLWYCALDQINPFSQKLYQHSLETWQGSATEPVCLCPAWIEDNNNDNIMVCCQKQAAIQVRTGKNKDI